MIIVVQQFINRSLELETLERNFKGKEAGLAVIYGRRRVGKTELLLHFAKEKGHTFFQADRRGYKENVSEFQRIATEALDNPLFGRARFDSWHEMFREILPIMGDVRLVVIDEYPYLIEEGANEEFQRVWDTLLSKSNVFLVLIGSSMSMMENKVLAHGAPLYGRRTMQMRVDKFPWHELRGFYPSYSMRALIEAASVRIVACSRSASKSGGSATRSSGAKVACVSLLGATTRRTGCRALTSRASTASTWM